MKGKRALGPTDLKTTAEVADLAEDARAVELKGVAATWSALVTPAGDKTNPKPISSRLKEAR